MSLRSAVLPVFFGNADIHVRALRGGPKGARFPKNQKSPTTCLGYLVFWQAAAVAAAPKGEGRMPELPKNTLRMSDRLVLEESELSIHWPCALI